MRVVQSLWTRPFGNRVNDRYNGGWPSEKHNYISWALSSLLIAKHYGTVHLVTDDAGARLLIDKLGLPYTSVDTSLETLTGYPVSIWALGKIKTYAMQSEPFIHVDGDVFLWDRLQEDIVHSPLFCQNLEVGASIYESAFTILNANSFKITSQLLKAGGKIIACNAGVIGGTNNLIWKSLWNIVSEFVDRNRETLQSCEHAHVLNLLLEQYLIHQLAMESNITPKVVFETAVFVEESDLMIPAEITRAIFDMKYTHLLGVAKKDRLKVLVMERIFQNMFPEKYYEILDVLN